MKTCMEQQLKPEKRLWTGDFTIITAGSAVSMFGNTMAGFAISLLVLDYTSSSMLYAIYLAVYMLPQIFAPFLSGPVLDRFSRKKTIYTLDFLSAGLYALSGFLLRSGWFSYPALLVWCFLVGTINSVYLVAYQSFYPLLISEGNFTKAYSVSSVLETLSGVMAPVSAFLYNTAGIFPLLEIIAVFFFIAAVIETRIKTSEQYIETQKLNVTEKSRIRQLAVDFREGLRYLSGEKGLLAVTAYFVVSSRSGGAMSVITLPFFRNTFKNGEYIYMLVGGMMVLGRTIGGTIHYRHRFPPDKKYKTAVTVYIVTSLIEGFYLYLKVPLMLPLMFVSGILSVTSYTIRISATQSYVPDEKKARFNGTFNMLNMAGTFTGELIAGAAATVIPGRIVLTVFMLVNALAAVLIVGVYGRKHIPQLYNREQ